MTRYRIEQVVVLTFAFLLGASLAICIAPRDRLLWVLAGIVLGFFCWEHFVREWAGDFFGWIPRHDHRPDAPVGQRPRWGRP